MTTTEQKRFLIIDDDAQNNLLSKMSLKKTLGDVIVQDFTMPEAGFEYIQSDFFRNPDNDKTVLLLDINMPGMNGWEFLEKFEDLDYTIKNNFDIYILSSSVDPRDIERAHTNPHVIDFIEKPLNKEILMQLFG